jgi:uncharacterized protein (DUF1015 family)
MRVMTAEAAPGRAPTAAPGRGLEVAPFRGLRFAANRVGDLAAVTAPPYDVIDADGVRSLEALEPHNVVRLILPRPAADDRGGRYEHAAATLRRWRADGTLVADPEPALYVYQQDSARTAQRGVLAAVTLRAPTDGVVLPHEDVMPGPVRDRLALMSSTQANLEPILLVHDGDAAAGAEADQIVTAVAARPPAVDLTTPEGNRHRLWTIAEPARVRALVAVMRRRHALIADGHHRYAAYRALQCRHHAAGHGAGPWDRGLALLVDGARYPLELNAIHRVVAGLSLDAALAAAGELFAVERVDGVAAALARLGAGRPRPAFALVAADGSSGAVLTVADPGAVGRRVGSVVPRNRPARYRSLDATVLHALLLDQVWAVAEDRVSYHHEVAAAVRAARVCNGVAVLLRPVRLDDVLAIAAAGSTMPRKSTSFGPKPRTGLVLRALDLG